MNLENLSRQLPLWGRELGFEDIGVSNTELHDQEAYLLNWLSAGRHGEMDYLQNHGSKRTRPADLVPGTLRVITARMNYYPADACDSALVLSDGRLAFISRYALGRDYHKVLRRRLRQLAERIRDAVGEFRYRVFTDSAPVLEVALAAKSGIGWQGKHTLLLTRDYGSWFFLGEIYTDLPLPESPPQKNHCGTCQACLDICPTRAITAPYQLDARRCISYLTIEHRSSIPEEFRALIGNRVYGCDDCQLVCPWNKFAQVSNEPGFQVRHGLDRSDLLALFAWSEEEFHQKLAGSAIHRIGYERWLRNLAVGLGNAPYSPAIVTALEARRPHCTALVREHVEWALERQRVSAQHLN